MVYRLSITIQSSPNISRTPNIMVCVKDALLILLCIDRIFLGFMVMKKGSKEMKCKLFYAILVFVLVLLPMNAFATEQIVGSSFEEYADDTMEISTYDAVTKTERTETISIAKLKAQNEYSKKQLGIPGENVLAGVAPNFDTELYSSEDTASTRTLFGENGQFLAPVFQYPYSSVMFLVKGIDLDDDGDIDETRPAGTGFLVGYNVMVTAAHVFFEEVNGVRGFIDECRIYPGQASNTYSEDPDTYYHPRSWTYSTVYAEAPNDEHDWIVATLFDPLGLEYGCFAVRDWSASISGYTAKVAGYPTDTPSKRYYQYTSSGSLTGIYPKRISYRMDAEHGNSGGPVYVLHNQVIGIHTGGGQENNWGLRIFEGLYTIIENKVLAAEEEYG